MKNEDLDSYPVPMHGDWEMDEGSPRFRAKRGSGYTVVGRTIIAHDDVRRWIRWVMITVVFVAIVMGVVTGHGVEVGIGTGAIETALFFVRRWF